MRKFQKKEYPRMKRLVERAESGESDWALADANVVEQQNKKQQQYNANREIRQHLETQMQNTGKDNDRIWEAKSLKAKPWTFI